jgi:hypothetical protein
MAHLSLQEISIISQGIVNALLVDYQERVCCVMPGRSAGCVEKPQENVYALPSLTLAAVERRIGVVEYVLREEV